MSSKIEIRRNKVKNILMRGIYTQEQITEQLKVSRSSVARDIRAIRKELGEEIKKTKFEDVLSNFLLQEDGTYQEAWRVYNEAKKCSDKIRALRLAHQIIADKLKILQSLGIIREASPTEREPITIEFVKPYWEADNNRTERAVSREVG